MRFRCRLEALDIGGRQTLGERHVEAEVAENIGVSPLGEVPFLAGREIGSSAPGQLVFRWRLAETVEFTDRAFGKPLERLARLAWHERQELVEHRHLECDGETLLPGGESRNGTQQRLGIDGLAQREGRLQCRVEPIAARITRDDTDAGKVGLFAGLAGEGIAADPAGAQIMENRAGRWGEIDGVAHGHLNPT